MNNLEINMENRGEEVALKCIGRLDANWAGHLNDYINSLVREGHYQISLDMTGIEYLSSAGIRSLVTQYKNLKKINGCFYIKSMSENVDEVLNMVGMADMLSQPPEILIAIKGKKEIQDQIEKFGFKFNFSALSSEGKTNVGFYGQSELVLQSGFKASNARLFKSEKNNFALGLGAIGNSFNECKNRFGEYIVLGKNIAYFPADGSGKPDYMVSSGQLVASLTELYGIHFEGNFTHLLRFESNGPKATIKISRLLKGIQERTKYTRFAIVMVAESGGLIATSLNTSPVDDKKIFSFPEIKDTVNFTIEPAHNKMLTLSVGYVTTDANKDDEKFIRPIQSDTKIQGHIHSTVFPYFPLKKTDIDLNETIEYLFNNSELIDVVHLTNDTREIVGLGESQFVQGFCWIVPVESTKIVSSL